MGGGVILLAVIVCVVLCGGNVMCSVCVVCRGASPFVLSL